ncbi:16S rRNA (guanine(966)-N(2))-methyltransferase RsmD ['Osedax' symbiont bacterium Rs2_46_30_T18]|nr:16S rRNA (guanine(966)-N(2))-methyltransferase RsmD ['Osedax' symbiont bacterium Rs2_46_30_T18]
MSPRAKQPKKPATVAQVRIIGGQWRSRKLPFPDIEGLRPTPDRVRETLFNWIQAAVPGAECLDLFAGSGALGFEALSRGAKSCTFVDLAQASCQSLRDNIALLNTTSANVVQQDAISWLKQPTATADKANKYHIVFLDPPFNKNHLQGICQLLLDQQMLHDNALIYIESEPGAALQCPWTMHREKISGQVHYRLYKT